MLVSDFLDEQLCDNGVVRVGRGSECTIPLNDIADHLDRPTRFVRMVEERVNHAIADGEDMIFGSARNSSFPAIKYSSALPARDLGRAFVLRPAMSSARYALGWMAIPSGFG